MKHIKILESLCEDDNLELESEVSYKECNIQIFNEFGKGYSAQVVCGLNNLGNTEHVPTPEEALVLGKKIADKGIVTEENEPGIANQNIKNYVDLKKEFIEEPNLEDIEQLCTDAHGNNPVVIESAINENEKWMAEYIEDALMSYSDEEDDRVIKDIRSFRSAGLMSGDDGIVVKTSKGTYQITIVKA